MGAMAGLGFLDYLDFAPQLLVALLDQQSVLLDRNDPIVDVADDAENRNFGLGQRNEVVHGIEFVGPRLLVGHSVGLQHRLPVSAGEAGTPPAAGPTLEV